MRLEPEIINNGSLPFLLVNYCALYKKRTNVACVVSSQDCNIGGCNQSRMQLLTLMYLNGQDRLGVLTMKDIVYLSNSYVMTRPRINISKISNASKLSFFIKIIGKVANVALCILCLGEEREMIVVEDFIVSANLVGEAK